MLADRRLAEDQTGKRRCVVAMREHNGRVVTHVGNSELEAVPVVKARVAAGSTVHGDEPPSWDGLHAVYKMERINHSV